MWAGERLGWWRRWWDAAGAADRKKAGDADFAESKGGPCERAAAGGMPVGAEGSCGGSCWRSGAHAYGLRARS